MKSAILFAVAFAATAWGAYVPEPRPKDKASQWWYDRHDVNRRWIAGCDGAYDLVFIGDSITHNWENSGHSILEGLRRMYSILNLGYCSDRIPHILWRLENGELDGYRAKGVMVMAGTNNYRDDPTNVVAGVRQILETVRARQPQAKILLCALLPSGTSDADERRQKNWLVNPLLKKLADEMKVEWIDFGDRFLGPDGAVVNMLKDNLHPDWKGYRDWAEAVQPVFTRWLGGDLFAQKDRQYLWPEGKMPDVQPHQGATLAKTCNEVFDPKKGGNTRPYLDWAMPPDPAKANGACLILVTGGGYHNCCDGEYVYARWPRLFRDLGFQCVTLIYRTPRAKGIPYYQTAWEDGQRAVRLVREAAAKRGYDPERIGTISVSAGAHLTSLLATSSQTPAYARIDATDDVSAHLNWAINFSTAYVRQGNGLDPILRFDGKTCPMCLCQGEEDPVSPECSIRMHAALRQRGVLSELHLRPHAGHGVYGTDAAVAFLRRLGLVRGALDFAWLKGVTDKNPLFYEAGEEMVFTLTLEDLEGAVPEGAFRLKWKRTGDDGVTEEGVEPVDGAPFVYRTRLCKPGFVRLYAEVVDAKTGRTFTKQFTGDATTPDGRRAMNRFEKRPRTLFFDGGAGVGIDTLQARPEPDDFDAFWERQRARLAKIPMKAERIKVGETTNVTVYAVQVDCAGTRPMTGYLTVPRGAEAGAAKFPCQLFMHGYVYRAPHVAPADGPANRVRLDINAHGMRLPAFGADAAYYKRFGAEIRTKGPGQDTYAFSTEENADPEVAYFNGMVLRIMRALQYLKSLPEWNGADLWAEGASQGGLQTIWAAACGEGVTKAEATIPWCCDLGGELAGRNRGTWFIPWADGLGYYDPVNFAKRIPKSCRTEICRAGLGDYICPPSGVAILWNNIPGNKKIRWVQGSTHGYVAPVDYPGRDIVRED